MSESARWFLWKRSQGRRHLSKEAKEVSKQRECCEGRRAHVGVGAEKGTRLVCFENHREPAAVRGAVDLENRREWVPGDGAGAPWPGLTGAFSWLFRDKKPLGGLPEGSGRVRFNLSKNHSETRQ